MTALSAVAEGLPLPVPRLRWSLDDGDWVLLVLDDVDGRMPIEPWDPAELARVLGALERLAGALTPAPISAMSIVDDLAENYSSWRRVAREPALRERLDSSTRALLPQLVELESRWPAAASGSTLLGGVVGDEDVALGQVAVDERNR